MTRVALVLNVMLCATALARGYALRDMDAVARAIVLLGALWLCALWRRWHWYSSAALIGAVLAAAVGILLDVSAAWMLAGAVFALVAWDLADFRRRLAAGSTEDDLSGIEQRHLLRLSVLTLGGLAFASLGMLVRLKVPFEWMLLLLLVTALGLAQFLRWLRDSR